MVAKALPDRVVLSFVKIAEVSFLMVIPQMWNDEK